MPVQTHARIGYVCISGDDPDLSLQRRALKKLRCSRIFEDHSPARARARLGLLQALQTSRSGDIIVVERLDRLGRSPARLIEILRQMAARYVGLRALAEQIDATDRQHMITLITHLLQRRRRIAKRDRRRALPPGLRPEPRPHKLRPPRYKLTADDIAFARRLILSGETYVSVAAYLKVSSRTLYRAFDRTQPGTAAVPRNAANSSP